MTLTVLEPGLSTTVQDTGRPGYYHIGLPPSGAMDQFAHRVANFLVGNDAEDATLEMTYLGPDLEFDESTYIAVTGADLSPTIDGEPIPLWKCVAVEAGQVISFEFSTEGTRAYLAVAGGIDVDPIMESRSTYTLVGIGGHEGRELEEGDQLPVGQSTADVTAGLELDEESIPTYDPEEPIRVVMGLCAYRLTDESRGAFLEAQWKVSDEADRVGYRVKGIDLDFRERDQPFGAGPDPSNVVDVGYPVGSIQCPEEPIVLMRDAVTGGGYATIGTVISPDRNRLAQRRTHQTVHFEGVDVKEALAARTRYSERLEKVRSSLLG